MYVTFVVQQRFLFMLMDKQFCLPFLCRMPFLFWWLNNKFLMYPCDLSTYVLLRGDEPNPSEVSLINMGNIGRYMTTTSHDKMPTVDIACHLTYSTVPL